MSESLLAGYRGQEAVDISKLEGRVIKLSDFMKSNSVIKEPDMNFVFAYSNGTVAVGCADKTESGWTEVRAPFV